MSRRADAFHLAERYLMHLMACALNGLQPDGLPLDCSWEDVFELACRNSISALTWAAAQKLDSVPEDLRSRWENSASMTMMRSIQLDAEREYITKLLREAGLSYLVLKGAVIARRYPDPYMRSMADNDILYGFVEPDPAGGYRLCGDTESERAQTRARGASIVREIMEGLGYVEVEQGEGACDIHFAKAPFLNFEMHHAMMEDDSPLHEYYANPWQRALRVDGTADSDNGATEYVFSDEDQYIYLIAHAFKHVNRSGFGVRLLADIAVILHGSGDELDHDYISEQLQELGISDFEHLVRGLSDTIMNGDPLDKEGAEIAQRMVECGTYGSPEEGLKIKMNLDRMKAEHDGGASHPRLAVLKGYFSPDEYCPEELYFMRDHALLRPLFPVGRLAIYVANACRHPVNQARKLFTLIRGK